jgi:hypothetical protein
MVHILFSVGDPHDIAVWLNGYYNGKRNNTILDTQEFREHAKKVMEYCESNPKSTVMDAAEKVLGRQALGRDIWTIASERAGFEPVSAQATTGL